MIELDIFHIRIILALVMLGSATIIDIRKREISDLMWIVFGVISGVLLFFEPNIAEAAFSVGFSLIVAPLVLILWRFGLFGGADALGLIVLSALAPMATLSDSPISPFTILVNSALISISPMIINFIRNSVLILRNQDIFHDFDETKSKKIFAMFLGYKSKNPKFSFSLEKQVGNNPVLIRIETDAGHGAGTPVSKTIEQYADIFGFALYNMGFEILPSKIKEKVKL